MIESDRAIYFEDDTGTSLEIMFNEHPVFILVFIASAPISSPVVDQHPVATPDNEPIEEVDLEAPDVVMDIPLRRSESDHGLAISMTILSTCRSMSMIWVVYYIQLSRKKSLLVSRQRGLPRHVATPKPGRDPPWRLTHVVTSNSMSRPFCPQWDSRSRHQNPGRDLPHCHLCCDTAKRNRCCDVVLM